MRRVVDTAFEARWQDGESCVREVLNVQRRRPGGPCFPRGAERIGQTPALKCGVILAVRHDGRCLEESPIRRDTRRPRSRFYCIFEKESYV